MTTQEAYDKMREWFSRPGTELGKIGNGAGLRCFYRLDKTAESTRRCAVGCLIPDEMYDPLMDDRDDSPGGPPSTSADDVLLTFPTLAELFRDTSTEFLMDAQRAHDCARNVKDFLMELHILAEMHQLDTTPLLK